MRTKHIADPVHGAIDLHGWEFEVIDTPSFQRLRRIKQLAMASQVYPGADHSRFVHSLGVFAIMSHLAARLHEIGPKQVTNEDVRKLRLAALLHDVGHYPYSHLMEKLKLPRSTEPDATTAILPGRQQNADCETPGEYPKHEELGRTVVTTRTDIRSVLEAYELDPCEIASIFLGCHGSKPFYNQLATSGLDADRLDYMLRDAHYSGVPYGRIDIEYILRNIRLDSQGLACIAPKAIASTEHFLLGRWYNYGAVVFQKTVMGMEALLGALLQRMVNQKILPNSSDEVLDIVRDEQRFLAFDDQYVDSEIRELAKNGVPVALSESDEQAKMALMAYAVLNRIKPRCVYEALEEPGRGKEAHNVWLFDAQIPKRLDEWARRFRIPRDFWLLGDSRARYLEEARPYGSITEETEEQPPPERQEQVRKLVRVAEADGSSTYLLDRGTSLLNPLAQARFRVVRLYILFPEEVQAVAKPPSRRKWRLAFKRRANKIHQEIMRDLGLG